MTVDAEDYPATIVTLSAAHSAAVHMVEVSFFVIRNEVPAGMAGAGLLFPLLFLVARVLPAGED
jgi:hypothetical protein